MLPMDYDYSYCLCSKTAHTEHTRVPSNVTHYNIEISTVREEK